MTNNEFVLRVLFSCRTLSQLKACREWVMDKYEFIDGIEIKPDGKRLMRRIDLHDTIREMEEYIARR